MNPDDIRTRVMPGRGNDADATVLCVPMDLTVRLSGVATVQLQPDATRDMHDRDAPGEAATRDASAGAESIRYVIVGEAGRGGMATVHVARDVSLLRNVALKQLSDELRGADEARMRFLREVQVTAQLDHPYIVPVYGLEVAPDGAPAYAMKLVSGQTLHDYLQDTCAAYESGSRPDEEHSLAARIEHLLKVCDGVDYAHGKGVIHRDLKPANIMLGAHAEIYVMDWGICRLFGESDPEFAATPSLHDSTGGTQTEYGTIVGTPRYMSPEQAQGRSDAVGPSSDQCALGLILFELVTLKSPFEGRTGQEVLKNAAQGRHLAITHAYERRAIDAPLRAIIERATRSDPSQRYLSVGELADDLRRYLRGEPVHALPDSAWQRAQRFVGRHRQGMLVALLGFISVGALGFIGLMWHNQNLTEAARQRETQQRDLMEQVAQDGDKLQLQLVIVQAKLESLALAATQLIQYAEPDNAVHLYWNADFLDPDKRPPDFISQPGAAQGFSLQSAVWSAAPGVDHSTIEPLAKRLSHLRDYRNQLIEMTRRNLGGGQYASGVREMKLALEQGLFMIFPGHALEDGSDLRESTWYRDMKAQATSHWGAPYVDSEGDDVLLPLTSPLRDPQGQFLGALSMDLAIDFIVHNLLKNSDGHALILLDADARVLASAELFKETLLRSGSNVLKPFGDATLHAAFKADEVGAVPMRLSDRDVIVAFDHIQPLGWILVLVADDPDAE